MGHDPVPVPSPEPFTTVEDFLDAVEQGQAGVPQKEFASRASGYADLKQRYPENAKLLLTSPDGHASPITALIVPARIAGGDPLSFEYDPREYKGMDDPELAEYARAKVEDLSSNPKFSDRVKLGISGHRIEEDGRPVLLARSVKYSHFLATGHRIANAEDGEAVRERLIPDDASIALGPDNPCSNHLGESSLIDCEGRLIFSMSSEAILCSPDQLVPPVSSSKDFPGGEDSMNIEDDVAGISLFDAMGRAHSRELKVDCGHAMKQESVVFLAFGQNLERGGKPEAFYYSQVPVTTEEYLQSGTSSQHQKKIVLSIESPLKSPTELIDEPAASKAIAEIAKLANWEDCNPILRANLCAFLDYVGRIKAGEGQTEG